MPLKKTTAAASGEKRPSGVAYIVGRLDHVLNKRLRDRLSPMGLTVPHYTALSVFRSMGTLSNAQLAERTMVSPQSANEMVKIMETKGLIEKKPDPSHGRIIHISLTKAGLTLLERCDAEVLQVEALMFSELREDELSWLHAQLRGAVRALSLSDI